MGPGPPVFGVSRTVVAAVRLGYEVFGLDVKARVGDPAAVGGGGDVTPPHGGGAAQPVVFGAGSCLGAGRASGTPAARRQMQGIDQAFE